MKRKFIKQLINDARKGYDNLFFEALLDDIARELEKRYGDLYEEHLDWANDYAIKCAEEIRNIELVNYPDLVTLEEDLNVYTKAEKRMLEKYRKDTEEKLDNVENIIQQRLSEVKQYLNIGSKDINIDRLFYILKRMYIVFDDMTEVYWDLIFYDARNYVVTAIKSEMNDIFNKYRDWLQNLKGEEEVVVAPKKKEIKKIFDFRRLEKEVQNGGYKFKRQTGSHRIYENEKGEIKEIPKHSAIKKGLSISILKDLEGNKR